MKHVGGHSYGQSIITIESEGERAVHMSDILPTNAHINPLWVMAYDDYQCNPFEKRKINSILHLSRLLVLVLS